MARKKTILKEDILNTAYELVRKEGFKGVTARNIAKEMDCSTQPIYLEFKNMEDLKENLFQDVQCFVCKSIFSKKKTGKPVLDACLNYIEFAKEEKAFFRALYLEDEMPSKEIHEVSYNHFKQAFEKDALGAKFSEDKKHELFEAVWPFVHGMAALVAQGYLPYDKENIAGNLSNVILAAIRVELPSKEQLA